MAGGFRSARGGAGTAGAGAKARAAAALGLPAEGARGAGGVGAGGVSLYEAPPRGEVALEELEHFALDRLKVLRGIERARSGNKAGEELQRAVKELWHQHMRCEAEEELHDKDVVSHYMLRLGFCRAEDQRRWLLDQETELFRWRFGQLAGGEQAELFARCGLEVAPLEPSEFTALQAPLQATLLSNYALSRTTFAQMMRQNQLGPQHFLKVAFEQVPGLVRQRAVFLHRGHAVLPVIQLEPLVVSAFRARLSKSLAQTAEQWAQLAATQERDRLAPLVGGLAKQYTGPGLRRVSSDGADPEEVSLPELPGLLDAHAPLCMRNLHRQLEQERHLKHGGRQQLGLFLKGIGLSLEDALWFWREHFAPRTTAEQFQKNYAYNVRHSYGKEGKRADYTPYSCLKIISNNPGTGDHHGCPFKTFSEQSLAAALKELKVSPQDQRAILAKAQGHHYQLACQGCFTATHGGQEPAEGVNHPNEYFTQSRQLAAARKAAALPGPAAADLQAGLEPKTPAAARATPMEH